MKKYLSLCMAILINIGLANSQNFYDINTINTIEITFEESNWDYLLDQLVAAGEEERLIGTVLLNGQFFDSVGVRYKGNSSYSANQVKNPLNIKLDHIIDDQLIEGYGTLKLANCFKDPSFIREALSYEIARNYMPASQSNYANVYINGTHLGLYTSDQSVDKFFMRTHFASDENARAKGEITTTGPPSGGVWEYYGTDSSTYMAYYDMKSDYGWADLIEFLDVLNNNNTSVNEYLNIDRHLWFLAFSNLLVNLDGPINNPQNHYLYKDDNGRFNPILWDLNESFGVFANHQTLGNLNTIQLQQFSPYTNRFEAEFPVISKILDNDSYRKQYVAHMKTIIQEYFDNGYYETRALEIQDIIDEAVWADQNKFYTYANFTSNVYNAVGGGPNGIIGIVQLMDARVNYLNGLADFQSVQPIISDVSHTPETAGFNDVIWVTASVSEEQEVYLASRSSLHGTFTKEPMYDDGNHEDAQPGDGIYGASITAGSTDIHYYIYAENNEAAAFSPVRAAYEFYQIEVSGGLVINEFMADNEQTIADQDGEYDDWIELYNNADEDIDLDGFYLTDDASEPDQWMFPDTTIASGAYLIIWADKDEDQNGLHANFKLSAEGETIMLSDDILGLVDEVNFLQQLPDTSTGRFENGVGDFIFMPPTFGTGNIGFLTGISPVDVNTVGFELKQNYPNPFDYETTITFSIDQASEVSLDIYNTLGSKQTCLVDEYLSAGEYKYTLNASHLKPGIYVYTLQVDAKHMVKKMVVQ